MAVTAGDGVPALSTEPRDDLPEARRARVVGAAASLVELGLLAEVVDDASLVEGASEVLGFGELELSNKSSCPVFVTGHGPMPSTPSR